MKLADKCLLSLICLEALSAAGQISSFQHIVVIVQENRTPDNLFQGLCNPPYGVASNCKTSPAASSKYNILTANWLDKSSTTGVTQPGPVLLGNNYDLNHAHIAFVQMYDNGKMDGARKISCSPKVGATCPPSPQYKFVDNSTGTINPYLELATQYGFANYMFQTNQGPSFPAHQFLFGGTSAPSAGDDTAGIFVAENTVEGGCIAPAGSTTRVVNPDGTETTGPYPCFEHQTMGDLMDNRAVPITWKYYAPSAGLHLDSTCRHSAYLRIQRPKRKVHWSDLDPTPRLKTSPCVDRRWRLQAPASELGCPSWSEFRPPKHGCGRPFVGCFCG